ncbi:MAG: hypothetical protein QOJ16_4332 [Acidobacteriota bacterium]|nr:hypothetical protein [Acidobacteriota bacterium]
MGEIHHCKPFTAGCLSLTAIRGNEKVRLVNESAPDVQGIERAQGMKLETAEGLFECVLSEITEIGVGEVGLDGGFEAPVVPGGKSALAHQSAQSRNQLGYHKDTDPESIRLGTEGPHLIRSLLLDIALGQRGGVEKDPHRFSSRSARTSSPRLRLPRESRV